MLERALQLSARSISRILHKHEIKPHLKRTYKVSRDPEFARKVDDVVGLYMNPPHNAVVLSVDEKTQVQALERTQLPLPLREGRAVRHTHDYRRHGVVDLYAALNVDSGHVTHACKDSHTGADFLSPAGTPIKAPAAGTVRLVGNLYYSGGSVIVDHGLGIYSLFAHMSKFDVSEGQTVAAGDVLGRVGATGRVTGAHLHWTVRMGPARVDPLSLVGLLPAPTTSR